VALRRGKGDRLPVRIINLTRGQALATAGRVADGFWSRLRGLIGSKPLVPGEGLVIVPCNAIHTHFMGFPIDVLYVSASQEILAIDHALPPWRFGRIHRGVRFVVELPAGVAGAANTQVGDQLQVEGCRV